MHTASKRPSRVKATIDKITGAALALINERGANALSVTEVCRLANVARPTLYRHFPTLDDLTDALFKRLCDEFDEEIDAAIALNPTPEHRIEVFAGYLAMRLARGHTRLIRTSSQEFAKQLVDKYFRNRQEIFLRVLAPVFDLAESLSGRVIDRDLAADVLTRYYISLQEHPIGTHPEDGGRALRQLMYCVTHLAPPPAKPR